MENEQNQTRQQPRGARGRLSQCFAQTGRYHNAEMKALDTRDDCCLRPMLCVGRLVRALIW